MAKIGSMSGIGSSRWTIQFWLSCISMTEMALVLALVYVNVLSLREMEKHSSLVCTALVPGYHMFC